MGAARLSSAFLCSACRAGLVMLSALGGMQCCNRGWSHADTSKHLKSNQSRIQLHAAHADVMKFKKHPATGAPLTLRELVQLTWHKNSDGEYHCPVMNKVFTEHTHIVAVRTAGNKGNVYCWEAVEELNIKPKNWKDLITGMRRGGQASSAARG